MNNNILRLLRVVIFKNRKLKKKLTILFVSTLTIALLLAALLYYELTFQKKLIAKLLLKESKKVETALADKLDHTENIMKKMISEIKKKPKNKVFINNVMKIYKTEPRFIENFSWTVFSWTDSDNKIIVDTKYEIMKKPYDLSDRDYIKLTQKFPDKLFLGRQVIGSTSKKWMIPAGVGAYLGGKYLGSMTIGFEIETLASILQKEIDSSKLKLTLFDARSQEKILTSYNFKYKTFQNTSPNLEKNIETSLSNLKKNRNLKIISRVDILKEKPIFLIKKLEKYPFIISLEYNKKGLKNEIFRLFLKKLKISLLILMMMSAIIYSVRYDRY